MREFDDRRPPFDRHVGAALSALGEEGVEARENISLDRIAEYRAAEVVDILVDSSYLRVDHPVPGHLGAEILVTTFHPPVASSRPRPAVFNIHGGGMVVGDRFIGLETFLPWVEELDVVLATVEYRLAPENPDPIPVEDCYSALCWISAHSAELGIDPQRIIVMGVSAGGGLAAGTVLLARDRRTPAVAGQILVCPMLDDRDRTRSSRQFEELGAWHARSNRAGWTALLGDRRGGEEVSIYAAPSRAVDLSALPPTYLDVGSAEVFRDEVVDFAAQLWSDGGVAELHVWPGGTHSWEWLAPDSSMTTLARSVRTQWLHRLLEDLQPPSQSSRK